MPINRLFILGFLCASMLRKGYGKRLCEFAKMVADKFNISTNAAYVVIEEGVKQGRLTTHHTSNGNAYVSLKTQKTQI